MESKSVGKHTGRSALKEGRNNSSQRTGRMILASLWNIERKSKTGKGRVTFASDEDLESVHFVETYYGNSEGNEFGNIIQASSMATSQLTEEIRLLSTEHGRSRRYLRKIPKVTLQAAVKYGKKERGHDDRQTGLHRWKYTFQNVVCITDHTSERQITCYKEPVSIQAAPISDDMLKRNKYVKRIIKQNPRMCTSHFVVILDQSGSMRTCDVNGFRTRSEAAYGCLALDFVAEQLAHEDASMVAGIDTVTLIAMNDDATLIFEEEPLDWILFNKLLELKSCSKPRSHGNYLPSIRIAKMKMMAYRKSLEGIDTEDLPALSLVLLSDGKPSDILEENRMAYEIESLSLELKDKFTFFTMGIGARDSDFAELKKLSKIATKFGGKGEFNHAGLSAASLGAGFSKIASSMSSVRSGLLSKSTSEIQKDETKSVVPLSKRQSFAKSVLNGEAWKATENVSRYKLTRDKSKDGQGGDWKFSRVPMIIKHKAIGFAMENIPFGNGTERFAYRFRELDSNETFVGKRLVAKETKGVRNELKRRQFHKQFCLVQLKAADLAKKFSNAIYKTQSLITASPGGQGPPKMIFLKCCIYLHEDNRSSRTILVENYLKGKFTKYNGNDGYVNKKASTNSPTIPLQGGEARLTDFIHAFSHWTYVNSDQSLLLCDLQGVLNQEGRSPRFELTDPAFCTDKENSLSSQSFGGTDIGLKGIRSFFRTHECNIVCKCLGLAESDLGVKEQ